ncbi:L-lactate permease [Treponema sp. OMZ 305]|uniref:L-lactate permease n=1 Tax=Treponema sp. OMZ 305 TaxID=1659192 RepID=UPI0020A378BF|nr:L-lactate permease [Treponema sp. OMZ 305]UTC57935.1 L-lactate permease [Treponema sp. OMZ 305]
MLLINFILAMLPIFWLIISLSKLKMTSCKACGIALLITAILAALYWKLPPLHISSAMFEGVAYALWPICLIIVAALFTYNLTIHTGAMEKIKGMLIGISDDKRILMLIIGWGFGNFMEGMAGFGTAVAIPASILAGIGLNPINAVTACLVANTTPTAFGSAGVPTATLASITGLDLQQLAANAALIQVVHAFLSPFLIVVICGGGIKALKGVWHVTLVASVSFVVPYLLFAQLLGPELPTIVGSICSMLCVILSAKFGKKNGNGDCDAAKIESEYSVQTAASATTTPAAHIGFAEGMRAWAPFMLIFILLILTSKLCPPVHNAIKNFKHSFMIYKGEGGKPLTFSWINTPGVMIFIAAICGGLIQKASLFEMATVLGATLKKYWRTFVTICSVLATAKVMIYSGMISDIAHSAVVATGPVYPFVAPLIGVLGAFVTGSGTSTNVLFGNLQLETALSLNLDPYWITAANVMGAGIGKMVCPQNIAIGAGAIGITGSDSKILAAVFKYFITYALLAGVICFTGSLLM